MKMSIVFHVVKIKNAWKKENVILNGGVCFPTLGFS